MKIDLAAILTQRLKDFPEIGAAANHFKVSTQAISKFGSTGNFPMSGLQILINELAQQERLWLLDAPGKPPTPAKVEKPAPEAPVREAMAITTPPVADMVRIFLDKMPEVARDERIALLEAITRTLKLDVEIAFPGTNGQEIPRKQFLSVCGNTLNLRTARLSVEEDETIDEAKNRTVQNFLANNTQWLLFIGNEVFSPFGNPGWMKAVTGNQFADEFAGIRSLDRLCASPERKIVGALYATPGGKMATAQFFGDETEDGKAAMDLIRAKGPQNKLIETPWAASGLMAIHRKVFEDVAAGNASVGEKAKGPFPFFAPMAGPFGSDRRFCALARKAGHKVYLDLAVYGARIVRRPFYAPMG